MIERCYLAESEISQLEVLNRATVSAAVSELENLGVNRLIITDDKGVAIYDTSHNTQSNLQEAMSVITQALEGSDIFLWNYQDGAMYSQAATPIVSYGTLIGCVYMNEYDTQQGALLHSLQINTLTITVILEIAVLIFSLAFSSAFTNRLRKIMTSMRIIREGDYSHKVNMKGDDELSVLGDEFDDLTERLQASESIRRQFVSDASHELKTPLASIKLLSDSILQNDMDLETVREFVDDIGHEADRLNRMSQKLLSLTYIESQQESDKEITGIADTIDRVVRMLSGMAQTRNITIERTIMQNCPILILEDDLYQIVFNLTENGIKYNNPGGKLSLSLFRQDDDAVLQISDTGVGIPEDSLSQIFERFYRVDKARSRQSGGSGLGLSIVKSMVERNGGQISVESAVNVGTTFTVVFPVFDINE